MSAPLSLPKGLLTTAIAAVTVGITAEQITQRPVFPHGVNQCDENGGAAS
jgi:hypothetical protein